MQNLPRSEVVLIVANTLAFVGAVAGVFVAAVLIQIRSRDS
jgi:hypothetical protein